LAKLGIVPGQPFEVAKLGPEAAQALAGVPKAAFAKIMASFASAGSHENGWVFTTRTGRYGTDYLNRALITAIGLGANRPEDAVYPTTETDAEGQPYSGANRYVMRFAKGQLPPAEAFWSLTMYDDQYFFVDNPLDRYTLSSRDALRANPDGSIDLYLQHDSPGPDKEANWLPAPAGRFIPMLRLYWPREAPRLRSWTGAGGSRRSSNSPDGPSHAPAGVGRSGTGARLGCARTPEDRRMDRRIVHRAGRQGVRRGGSS